MGTFQLNHAGGMTVQTATGPGPFDGTFTEEGNYLLFANVFPKPYFNNETDQGFEFEFFWGHDGSGTAAINGIQVVKGAQGAFSISGFPIGTIDSASASLDASVVDGASEFESAVLYLDDVAVQTKDSSSGGTNSLEYAATGLSAGTHTCRVDVVSTFSSPSVAQSHSWTFEVLPFSIVSTVPAGDIFDDQLPLQATILEIASIVDSSGTKLFLDGIDTGAVVDRSMAPTSTISYVSSLSLGMHTGKVVVVGDPSGGPITNEWTFTVNAFGSITTTPTGSTTNDSPVLQATIIEGASIVDNTTRLYLDGIDTGATLDRSLAPTSTISYATSGLSYGMHTGKVVVVGSPAGTATNEWTFSVRPPDSVIAGILYNINFAGKTGAVANVADGTVIPAAGTAGSNLWNNVVAASNYDAAMTNTTVITDAATGGHSIGMRCLGTDHWFDIAGTAILPLNQGFWISNDGDHTVELTGLEPSATYDIYVYCTWNWTEDSVAYSITKGSGQVTNLTLHPSKASATGTTDYSIYVDGSDGTSGNYVVFSNLTPDASGVIDILAQSTQGGFSGLQVVRNGFPGPTAQPVITGISVSGSDVTLSWTDEGVGTYTIQRKTGLTAGSWTDVQGGLPAGTGSTTVTTTGASQEFYQIKGE